jgi:hypothetical protein
LVATYSAHQNEPSPDRDRGCMQVGQAAFPNGAERSINPSRREDVPPPGGRVSRPRPGCRASRPLRAVRYEDAQRWTQPTTSLKLNLPSRDESSSLNRSASLPTAAPRVAVVSSSALVR